MSQNIFQLFSDDPVEFNLKHLKSQLFMALIKLIRESSTPNIAQDGLMTEFGMSEIQAKAVLELRLQRLTGMEIDKIREEHAEIMKLIERLKEILANESMRFDIIKTELAEVKAKFGDERKTTIEYADDEINMLDLIEEEDVVVTISHLGYIKRTSARDYRQQRRGGFRAAVGDEGIVGLLLEVRIVEVDVGDTVRLRRQHHQPSVVGKQRRYALQQSEMAEVVGRELRFEAIDRAPERRRHDAGVGDDGIELAAVGQ